MNDISQKNYKYLNRINSPSDLKALSENEIEPLAKEIRQELVDIVTKNGGHLASNLGVVEMTLAIHRVFDAPHDHIIFDVGHQSYVHKILTGRLPQMDTLRKAGGISGFTNRSESQYDCFGAGHSSTSLSASLGFAISDKLSGSDAYTVCVVGDGAYTGGMIHEALNNCRKDVRLIIIMNENEMSISKNIGSFAKHLSKLRSRSGYFSVKKATGIFLKKIPFVGKKLFRFVLGIKKTLKNVLYGSNYFESMGLTYLGPVDGNDYFEVENILKEAKKLSDSVVVHIKTQKGKGYEPAEKAPDKYHGMSPFGSKKSEKKNFSAIMGEALANRAESDGRICAVTAAMGVGTGLEVFAEKYADRFFDVGIAEEHAATFAAGLAANGMKPYFAVYSSFLQRAYDNVIHDIALQKLPVTLLVDRAGLNSGDGATHHGIFDVAFLSGIPNMRIYTPVTEAALKRALDEADKLECPCAIRYPNGVEDERVVEAFYKNGEPSKPSTVRDYLDNDSLEAVIITHGRIVSEAMLAKEKLSLEGINIGIILLEMLKPYGKTAKEISEMLPDAACKVIFLEEEIRNGGMGMILSDTLSGYEIMKNKTVLIMSVDDTFVERHSGESIYESAKISADDIVRIIKE